MSDEKQVVTDLDSSFFQAYSKKVQDDSKQKTGGSNFAPREFEDIGYVGLEKGVNKIVRMIGAPPDSDTMGYKRKEYDPLKVMMCEVKDDEGKKFNIKLPLREDIAAHNHILHRLYDKVTEVVWVSKKKVFINETKHPELWKMITKGNYQESDGMGFSIAAGFKSTVFTIMNVIDRHDEWCATEKSCKILCNDLNVGKDKNGNDTIWAKPGIKAFSLNRRIADLVGKYGNYETYDVAIKKTGEKDNPIELRNASLYKSKDMMEELKNTDGTLPDESIIVVGPLTSEEKAYKRYDLNKIFQPTSYTKILKRIPALFKLCDACLGTKFYEELEQLSKKEKEEWEKLYPKTDTVKEEAAQAAEENVEIQAALKEETPKRRAAVGPVPTGLSNEKIAVLTGWSKLNDEQKSLIKDVKLKDGKFEEIVWEPCDKTSKLYACDCGAASPEIFTSCPVCGGDFFEE